MINKVVLIGNLGSDPEIRTLESGAMVAKIGVATSENYRDKAGEWQSQTEWHDVVMWRYLAERAQQTLKKGSQVYIEGKLTHRTWEDKDGNKRKTTEVVAAVMRLLGKREDNNSGGRGNFPTEEPPNSSPSSMSSTPSPASTADSSSSEGDDDLPF